MPNNDLFLQTIEAVYASGLDRDRLPEALEATNSLIGGAGALLEVIDKPTRRHREYCSVGLPNVARAPYIEQFAALNPRIPFAFRQPRGKIICDYQVLDEDEMSVIRFIPSSFSLSGCATVFGPCSNKHPTSGLAYLSNGQGSKATPTNVRSRSCSASSRIISARTT